MLPCVYRSLSFSIRTTWLLYGYLAIWIKVLSRSPSDISLWERSRALGSARFFAICTNGSLIHLINLNKVVVFCATRQRLFLALSGRHIVAHC